MLGNTQKRLFWKTSKTGLGTFWAQSGHIEEIWDFLGILKPLQVVDFKGFLIGRTTQIRTGDLYHVKVAL